jgi:competence ComEA-like helix-hairpin-helix protein
MYQHDLSSSVLNERLTEVIQECVNSGGVDVNTASAQLLQYVAGLNASRAKAIVEHRVSKGAFRSVSEVRSVKGIGDISYHNAAGFLRVFGGTNPLDTTAVHPEHYDLLLRLLGWADLHKSTTNTTINAASAASSSSSKTGSSIKAKGKAKSRSFELIDASDIGSDRMKALCSYIISHQDEIPMDILTDLERSLDFGSSKSNKSSDNSSGRSKTKRKLDTEGVEDSSNDSNPPESKRAKTDSSAPSSGVAPAIHSGDRSAIVADGEAVEPQGVSLRDAALTTITKWMDWMSRPTGNKGNASERTSSSVTGGVNSGWISEDMRAGNPPTLIRFDATTREVVGRLGITGQGSEPLHALVGRSFEGVVKNIVPFGAFVDIGASNSGLLHKSQFGGVHKLKLGDIVIGQRIKVKVAGIKPVDRIELCLDA